MANNSDRNKEHESNVAIVKEYIRNCIKKDCLRPGDLLPSECQIAKDLNISRNSVKEATRALECIGLIEIKHGKGLILREFNLDAILEVLSYGFLVDRSIIFDLYEIRKMIETTIIKKAAQIVDEKTILKCELILAEWAYKIESNEMVHDLDRKFHDTLYKPLGNDLLIGLCDLFWASFKEAEIKGVILSYTPNNKKEALSVLEEHRHILEEIKKHDPEKSAEAMINHFRELIVPGPDIKKEENNK